MGPATAASHHALASASHYTQLTFRNVFLIRFLIELWLLRLMLEDEVPLSLVCVRGRWGRWWVVGGTVAGWVHTGRLVDGGGSDDQVLARAGFEHARFRSRSGLSSPRAVVALAVGGGWHSRVAEVTWVVTWDGTSVHG